MGSLIIKQLTGKYPRFATSSLRPPQTPPRPATRTDTPARRLHTRDYSQDRTSPVPSPARFLRQQRNLEALFQEVSEGIQRKADSWSISKAVLGAVGQVTRNVNSAAQSTPTDVENRGPEKPQAATATSKQVAAADAQTSAIRARELEERNKLLSNMLEDAISLLKDLQNKKKHGQAAEPTEEDGFDISLAKIKFVSLYLADSNIPIPGVEEMDKQVLSSSKSQSPIHTATTAAVPVSTSGNSNLPIRPEDTTISTTETPNRPLHQVPSAPKGPQEQEKQGTSTIEKHERSTGIPRTTTTDSEAPVKARPSLANSSFSFMLGESQHRSGFVSSISDLPENRRASGGDAEMASAAAAKPTAVAAAATTATAKLWPAHERSRETRKKKNPSAVEHEDEFSMQNLLQGDPS